MEYVEFFLILTYYIQVQVIQDDQLSKSGLFLTNQRGLVPPLVTTDFTVQDSGNASPRLIRSTMYCVPTTTDIMKQVNTILF